MLQHNEIRKETTSEDKVIIRSSKGLTVWSWGLSSGEKIVLQLPKEKVFNINNDEHWTSNFLELTSSEWVKTLYGPFIARIVKEETQNMAGFGYVYG